MPRIGVQSWFSKLVMLTMLNFVLQTVYSTICFATSLLFWGLYAANPEYVVPKWAVGLIPQWHNHVTHTAPMVFLMIDTLLTCHHAPSKKTGSIVVLSLYAFYLAIIFFVKLTQGYWLYPVFNHLSNQLIFFFLAFGGILLWFLYLIGDGFNSMIWGKAPHANPSSLTTTSTVTPGAGANTSALKRD
uniref:Uncharacterized protein n=1 Tax=Panagrolaimus davidi TaxID=227884 RepID=A0A914P646_9BILA